MHKNDNREREMKKLVSLFVLALFAIPAFAATQSSQARRSMTSQMVMNAPRATASTNQISAMASINAGNTTVAETADKSSVRLPDESMNADTSVSGGTNDAENNEDDNAQYEKMKIACLSNNIGVGNTFVWASRYSNTANYASMVEDVNNPENNVCFVLVSVKSNDPKISVSDVPEKYFQMGQNITCGSWADEETLRQRILDAKKSARTWATVGGVVGGAGVGVGAMELFGNRLIGGSVMGQKALEGDQQLLAQLRALKQQSPTEFEQVMDALETLKKECDGWQGDGKPSECDNYDYDILLNAKN